MWPFGQAIIFGPSFLSSGSFACLKNATFSVAAKNRNCDSPAVPADEMLFNQLVGDAAAIKILPDSLRQIRMELPGKLHEIFILVCHPASVAIECSKKRIRNLPERTIN